MPVMRTALLAALFASTAVDALKVVSMPMGRVKRSQFEKRASNEIISAELDNGLYLYYINVTIGTPGQLVQVQLDTGSSDLWVFSPAACAAVECTGGSFDSTKSSTYKLLDQGGFEIQYDTPGSGVTGDYISDNCEVGGMSLQAVTLAVASTANNTNNGIMGVGFDTDESLASQTGHIYQNIVDLMVKQKLINTRAYSLYLDDLEDSTGSIIFGGYDTGKFSGDLVGLDIQPDADSGNFTSMTVVWTSLSITQSGQSQTLTADDFAAPAVLDSGTTLTVVPDDIANTLINAVGAVFDQDQGTYVLPCSAVAQNPDTAFVFGFEGSSGKNISVDFHQFVVPLFDNNGNLLTDTSGETICEFGIAPSGSIGGDILFGDTFLRAAYVVYDLDNLLIGIAPTVYNSTVSNLVEIGANGETSSISVASGVTAQQTASIANVNGQQSLTGSALVTTTGTLHSGSLVLSGATASATLGAATTTKGKPTGTTGSAGAATPTSSKAAAGHVQGQMVGGLLGLLLSFLV